MSVSRLGDAIVHNHSPIAEETDGFFAVEPPHGRRIGANGHADVLDFTRAVDDCDGPEEDAVGRLVQSIGKAKKLDVEIGGIQGVPCEFLTGNRHFVAVAWNDSELVWEVLRIHGVPNIGVGKHGIGAVRLGDRLEKQPALEETVLVRRF